MRFPRDAGSTSSRKTTMATMASGTAYAHHATLLAKMNFSIARSAWR